MRRLHRRAREDRGSLPSTLIMIPILLIFMELIIFGGRAAGARADVNAAASEAARMASIAAGADTAGLRIEEIAMQTLDNRGLQCLDAEVRLSTESSLQRGGIVAVEVECTLDATDLGFLAPFAPGEMKFTVTGVGFEAIDPLRVFIGDDVAEEVTG